jgi:hypothetical protein
VFGWKKESGPEFRALFSALRKKFTISSFCPAIFLLLLWIGMVAAPALHKHPESKETRQLSSSTDSPAFSLPLPPPCPFCSFEGFQPALPATEFQVSIPVTVSAPLPQALVPFKADPSVIEYPGRAPPAGNA